MIGNKDFLASKQAREEWIDVIKGFLIFLVVIGHCILTISADSILLKAIVIFIYSFHMPLFFIMSGYLFNKKYNFNVFLLKKFKSLILPYIMFIIVDSLVEILFGVYSVKSFVENISAGYKDIVLMTTKSQYSSLWFLPAMFFGILIVYGIEKNINDKIIKWVISIFILSLSQIWYKSGIESFFCIREAMIAQFFIILGYESRDKINNVLLNATFSRLILFLIVWVISIIEWVGNHNSIINYWNSDVTPVSWSIVLAIMGSLALISFVGIWLNYRRMLYKLMIILGENSLYIYGFHYIFIRVIPQLISKYYNAYLSVAISTFAVLLCAMLITIVYRNIKKIIILKE